jgi:peptide/nickel transport system permease protein
MASNVRSLDAGDSIAFGGRRAGRGWISSPGVRQFLRNRAAVAALLFFILLIAVAAMASSIAPYEPTKVAVTARLKSPSSAHLLGTDQFGRDVWSRLLYGSRLTFFYAFIAVGLAAGVGVFLGAIAGYARGWVDSVIMRLMDILLAFPSLLLALVVLTVLGSGLVNAEIAVGISLIPVYVRLVRGTMLSVREREYVLAARVVGCSPARMLTRHILSNVWSQVIILSTTALGWAIVIAATLNFLGLGVKPPTAEWGADLAAGRQWLNVGWWVSTSPGVAITLVILAVNYLGDGLTEALDPGLRRR